MADVKEEKPVEGATKTDPKVIIIPEDFKTFPKRTVKVKRFNPSSLMSNYPEVYIDAKTSIASFIDADTNSEVRPLSREEEFVLMPELLNLRPDAPEFNAALSDFFNSISVDIPDEGLELDVTILEEKTVQRHNGEQLKIEIPVNTHDYVFFKLVEKSIKKNFRIANSLKDCVVGIHEFYIEDIQKDNADKNKAYKKVQNARLDFINLTAGELSSTDKEKIEMLFDMTYNIHNKHVHNTAIDDIIRILDEEVLQKDPSLMVSLMNDENLADKALIKKLATFNVLTIQGNVFFNESEPMGEIDDAIKYLNNPNRAGIKEKLKAKLQQKLKLVK